MFVISWSPRACYLNWLCDAFGVEDWVGELCTPCDCNPLVEGSIVDWKILHGGEGGDVKRWVEPRNKSLCLQLFYCLYLFLYHSFILVDQYSSQQDSNWALQLLSRGITRRSSEPFTGNPASSLVLIDRLHHFILYCIEFEFD